MQVRPCSQVLPPGPAECEGVQPGREGEEHQDGGDTGRLLHYEAVRSQTLSDGLFCHKYTAKGTLSTFIIGDHAWKESIKFTLMP